MSDLEDHHGESLVIKVAGRDALPVRAIPYVTGWLMSPDDIAKQFGRVTDKAFSKLENTHAFHMQGVRAVKLLPKEWDRYIATLQALEIELRIRFPDKDLGYAAWLSRSAEKLPPGVFVWLDEFLVDFERDHGKARLSVLDERDGDRELNLSPFLEVGVRDMVLQGFRPTTETTHGQVGRRPQVSIAPEPIKPLSGAGYSPTRKPRPANWNKWKFIPKAQLWEAVCLTFDVEPDEEVVGMRTWLQSRRGVPRGLPPEFVDRLQMAQANMSTNGPIRPLALYSGVLQNPHAEVSLSEIAAFAVHCGWTLPEPMKALAPTITSLATTEDARAQFFKATAQDALQSSPEYQAQYVKALAILDEISEVEKHATKSFDERERKQQKLAALRADLEATNGINSHVSADASTSRAGKEWTDECAPATTMNKSAAGEAEGPMPLTTSAIANCFAGLRWDEKGWKKPLGDLPKWLEPCLVIQGRKGVSERRWNPVFIGAALVRQEHSSARSVRARFQSKADLIPWLEAWKTYEADFFDTP